MTLNKELILDVVYPVGAIYMSVNSTNPESLFGGSWTQLSGRFLLGAGSNDANTTTDYGSMSANTINRSAGERGGEATHTLTVSEMPQHTHDEQIGSYKITDANPPQAGSATTASGIQPSAYSGLNSYVQRVSYSGGGQPHNNMPPYLVVYMWKRTS